MHLFPSPRGASRIASLRYLAGLGLIVVGLALTACAPPEAPPAPEPVEVEPVRVESPALGIAISDLSSQFEVVEQEGDALVLQRSDGTVGTVTITRQAPEVGGVNLLDLVEAAKQDFNSRPGGEYHGQVELGTPLGVAFSVRGSYTAEDGTTVEERHVYGLHPSGKEALVVRYVYPAVDLDDTRARTNELFEEVYSLIEPLPVATESEAV